MKRLIVFVAFLACLPFLTFSQYTISGIVYDKETKTTLAGAHVIMPGTFKSTISGTKGEFKISGLQKGEITLKITYMGYKSFIGEYYLQGDLIKHVELEKSPIMQDAVIIKATRAYDRTPVVYSTLTKKEIKKVNLGKDLPYLLKFGPSVTITSDAGNDVGYSSIRIRGTDMRGINVTINGIPLNDPESHNVFWVDLPDFSSSVENIQIQRGVGTSTNGAAAFGASINIQTNSLEAEPYAAVNTSFGSFNTYKNNLALGTGLIGDKFSFDARISKIVSDGYIDRASSDLTSLFASGAFYGKSTLLKINYFTGKEKTYQAWEGVPSDSLKTNRTYNPAGAYFDDNGSVQYYDNQTDNYKQDNFQLTIAQELGSKFLINLATHYTKGKGYYESYKTDQKLEKYGEEYFISDSSVTRSDLVRQKWLDNDFSGITFSGIYDSKRKLKLTIGGAWNTYSGDHFGYVIWAKEALIKNKDKQYYFNNGKKTDMNVFAKVDYAIGNKLNIYGDIQYRYIDYLVKGTHDNLMVIDHNPLFNFFNPKMGLFYVISDKHKTFFSFAIANREPSRRNYIDADPGKTPTYETLYDYELGYDYSSAKARAGLNLYYMDYNNQLVLTGEINNVGDPIMVNVPASFRMGIEINAAAKIFNFLSWDINLTVSRNQIKNFTEYIDNWDTWTQESIVLGTTDLSFSPGIITTNRFTFEPTPGLDITIASKYVGKQYIDNTSSDERKLNAYFINDLILNYHLNTSLLKELGINLIVSNIFNEKYETNAWIYRYIMEGKERYMDGYFPMAGFNFQAGVFVKF